MAVDPYWSDERTARLRELFNVGRTGSQIAASLGITRNAAIGKLHRLGLRRKPAGAAAQDDPTPIAAEACRTLPLPSAAVSGPPIDLATPRAVVPFSADGVCAPVAGSGDEEEPALITVAAANGSIDDFVTAPCLSPACMATDVKRALAQRDAARPRGPVPLTDLPHGCCHWVGEVATQASPALYCGARATSGTHWCAEHRAIVYRPRFSKQEASA